jgi:threonine/homoserine efflux transporter RhtA
MICTIAALLTLLLVILSIVIARMSDPCGNRFASFAGIAWSTYCELCKSSQSNSRCMLVF